ncbi:MAG: hypothetical protein CMO12_00475 [Thaumarchaeota archaeon]|nr:hypothetical protein [Nitrososphaerota archaeon]
MTLGTINLSSSFLSTKGAKRPSGSVYHGQAFSLVPMLIDEENMNLLSIEVAGNAKIKKMLKRLAQ